MVRECVSPGQPSASADDYGFTSSVNSSQHMTDAGWCPRLVEAGYWVSRGTCAERFSREIADSWIHADPAQSSERGKRQDQSLGHQAHKTGVPGGRDSPASSR